MEQYGPQEPQAEVATLGLADTGAPGSAAPAEKLLGMMERAVCAK
jgi:hypothetical protein